MKRFILGLILMFTFSFVGNSFGYAIPNDAKIEKVFKQDVEKISIDIVSIKLENLKIAELGSLKPEFINYSFNDGMLIDNSINVVANYSRCYSDKLNYNLTAKKKSHFDPLPLKVGWRNSQLKM